MCGTRSSNELSEDNPRLATNNTSTHGREGVRVKLTGGRRVRTERRPDWPPEKVVASIVIIRVHI